MSPLIGLVLTVALSWWCFLLTGSWVPTVGVGIIGGYITGWVVGETDG